MDMQKVASGLLGIGFVILVVAVILFSQNYIDAEHSKSVSFVTNLLIGGAVAVVLGVLLGMTGMKVLSSIARILGIVVVIGCVFGLVWGAGDYWPCIYATGLECTLFRENSYSPFFFWASAAFLIMGMLVNFSIKKPPTGA